MTASASGLFAEHRPGLLRIGYRMLGSMTEAEDIVQEAYIRWSEVDLTVVRTPAAFLRRIVTHLSLDHLRSARIRREVYSGPWLPEPLFEEEPVEDVTLPLLLALERLSPLERAAFLLHDVFGQQFEDVSASIGRDVAACRQLASRARANIRHERPRFPVARERGLEIASAFFEASTRGSVDALERLLSEDVRLHADGGGKRPSVARVMTGLGEVSRTYAAIMRLRRGASELIRFGFINGLPGFVTREPDGMLQTTALIIDDDQILAVYVMRNPDKLRSLDGTYPSVTNQQFRQ